MARRESYHCSYLPCPEWKTCHNGMHSHIWYGHLISPHKQPKNVCYKEKLAKMNTKEEPKIFFSHFKDLETKMCIGRFLVTSIFDPIQMRQQMNISEKECEKYSNKLFCNISFKTFSLVTVVLFVWYLMVTNF